MVHVYVIKSMKHNYRYVGITNNFARRLKQHNEGYNLTTKPYATFETVLVENCASYEEARKREKFLKSGQGRKFL